MMSCCSTCAWALLSCGFSRALRSKQSTSQLEARRTRRDPKVQPKSVEPFSVSAALIELIPTNFTSKQFPVQSARTFNRSIQSTSNRIRLFSCPALIRQAGRVDHSYYTVAYRTVVPRNFRCGGARRSLLRRFAVSTAVWGVEGIVHSLHYGREGFQVHRLCASTFRVD